MALNRIIFILLFLIESNASLSEKIEENNSFDEDVEKYILIWQSGDYLRDLFGEEQESLLKNECPIDNCFITSNRSLFGGDLRKFDAIIFDGSDQNWYVKGDLPNKRYNHQNYIYVQRESAALTYVCHTGYNNFFNWTMTYKLNSNFILPYFNVKDINEKIVGPRKVMHWKTNSCKKIDKRVTKNLNGKSKAAAWFYSNCNISRTNYEFVKNLQRALQKYDLNVDVYGKCGPLLCSLRGCDKILNKDYYFYLALEDSFAEDYVTGNVLRALRNNVVPIVYGGANYSRFLPPESYLDGTSQTPEELATVMNNLIENKTLYANYFWWKSHYSFCLGHASPKLKGFSYCGKPVCDLCKSLHDPKKTEVRSAIRNFRKWWYPDYKLKCDKRHASDLYINLKNEENALKNLIGSDFSNDNKGRKRISKKKKHKKQKLRKGKKYKKNKKKANKSRNYTMIGKEGVNHIKKLQNYTARVEKGDNNNKVKSQILEGEGNMNIFTKNEHEVRLSSKNITVIKEGQLTDKNTAVNHTLEEAEKIKKENKVISDEEKSKVDLDSSLRRSGSKDILELLAEKIILRRMSMISEKGSSGQDTPDEEEKERSLSMFSNNIVLS